MTRHEPIGEGEINRHDHKESKLEKAVEWLDEKLFPYLGPPALGPYDKPEVDPPATLDAVPCPICGQLMSAHITEVAEDGRRFLRHPDERFRASMETGSDRRR
ncbi:hypothetical protein ACO2Q7_11815 [Rathayibacter sp. KR2-224]|uniref:hypothetical protein n=1 Tax=Rathayibacter sp. KR2-224 TaxID=3400913 RepID=UPI003C011E84